jgi:two-component system, NtrC family, response regulator HydG
MSKTLLLVDDDEANTQILGIILEDAGFNSDTALTGAEALRKLKGKQYDLILLDYVLPDVKGDDLAADIQVMYPKTKIILLSGYSKSVDTMSDRGTKYSAILLKPISPDDIVSEINKALN